MADYKTRYQKSILNITGVPSDDFIEEISDSRLRKKNQIFFALLVNGLPGDPGFGVGLSELVAEQNTDRLKRLLKKRAKYSLMELVSGIRFDGMAVEQIKDKQFIGADFHFTDLDTNEKDYIPLGFKVGG